MKSKMPQIGEAVFCIIYLLFGYIAGGYMTIEYMDRGLIFMYGILTLVLAGGDSFHLIPRILNAFLSSFEAYDFWAGLGLMVSSITMTIFYVILYAVFQILSPDQLSVSGALFAILCVLAVTRMLLCLMPQNNWFHKEGNPKWGMLRNIPFTIMGIIMIYIACVIGQYQFAIAIFLSFACYLPVVLWAKKKPMIGMLMIPKTMAYMWIIGMGLAMI